MIKEVVDFLKPSLEIVFGSGNVEFSTDLPLRIKNTVSFFVNSLSKNDYGNSYGTVCNWELVWSIDGTLDETYVSIDTTLTNLIKTIETETKINSVEFSYDEAGRTTFVFITLTTKFYDI